MEEELDQLIERLLQALGTPEDYDMALEQLLGEVEDMPTEKLMQLFAQVRRQNDLAWYQEAIQLRIAELLMAGSAKKIAEYIIEFDSVDKGFGRFMDESKLDIYREIVFAHIKRSADERFI